MSSCNVVPTLYAPDWNQSIKRTISYQTLRYIVLECKHIEFCVLHKLDHRPFIVGSALSHNNASLYRLFGLHHTFIWWPIYTFPMLITKSQLILTPILVLQYLLTQSNEPGCFWLRIINWYNQSLCHVMLSRRLICWPGKYCGNSYRLSQ